MAKKQEGPGVYDSPVHGSREQSEREVNARLAEAPPSDEPMPEMRHGIEGASFLVEESSGVAAAEASGRIQPNNEAPAAESAGSG